MRPALCLAVVALVACERDAWWNRAVGASGPYALDDRAAWTLSGEPAVAFFDPVGGGLTREPLSAEPLVTETSPDGRGLLVLDVEGGAHWYTRQGGGVATRRYALGAPFGALTWSPDGRFVVAHHGGPQVLGQLITNPNQMAVIDLSRPPGDDNPVPRTFRSFGGVPRSVVVSPAGMVAGVERQLGWVLSDGYLALFDLMRPAAREVVVHLTLPEDTRRLTPVQVVAAEVEGRLTAFVRTSTGADVFALTFPEAVDAADVPRPTLNQLPAGGTPADILAQTVEGGTRLFVVNGRTGTLGVLDPVTGRRRLVETGVPVFRILPFTAPRADEGGDGRFALLWTPGSPAVVFADLDRVEQRAGRALTPLRLGAGIDEVAPLPGRRGAAAHLGRELVLLDFDDRTATPLVLAGGAALDQIRVAPDGRHVFALVRAYPDDALVSVDVDTGVPRSAPLALGAATFLLLPGAGRLLLDHGDPLGAVTIAPLGDVSEESLETRSGILMDGVFDR